jgi:hypothetical protein
MANLPPKDVAPSELFAKLTSVDRPHKIVDLPRKGADGEPVGQVAMVPLTQYEMMAAAASAEKQTRELLKGNLPQQTEAQLGYNDVYNNSAAAEVLFRACKKPDDLKSSAFRTPHEIGTALSTDEIGVLYHHYETVKAELGPIVSTMTEDEVEAWVAVLAKGGSYLPLDTLSWGALTTLVLSMASLLQSFLTDRSSLGSPAEPQDSTSEDTTES